MVQPGSNRVRGGHMRRGARAVVAIAVLALVATACRSSGDTDGGTGAIKTGVGVEGNTIVLGELSPLTGPVAVIGKPLTKGHEVYFQYVNEVLGGVGKNLAADKKYKIRLETLDTQYVPQTHAEQYGKLKDKVLMIAQSLGTGTTKAILEQIRADKILTGAATLASDWLKEKYVIPAGAPYPVQAINAFAYVVNEQKKTPKVGVIYQDDDYGIDGLKGVEYAAGKLNFQIVAKATYKPTDKEFVSQVTAMKNAGADHVFLVTVPSATGGILGTAAQAKYTPQWIGQSPSWIGALASSPLKDYLKAYMWVTGDAACDWGSTAAGCEGMKEMVDNLAKYGGGQTPDTYFQFGYTQARIVHQILEKAVADGDLTRDGVVKAFESLSNVDMGGLLNTISYGTACEDKVPATGTAIYSIDAAAPTGLKRLAAVDDPIVKDFPFCG